MVPNGKNIAVTNENKHEYVQKLTEYKLYLAIKDQIDAFVQGFYEMVPKNLTQIFNFNDIELLISGLPTIDI